jgi:hypothetical protein
MRDGQIGKGAVKHPVNHLFTNWKINRGGLRACLENSEHVEKRVGFKSLVFLE